MLERRSALQSAHSYVSPVLTIVEDPDVSLTQVAGEDKVLAKLLGTLPETVGVAVEAKGRTILRIGPKQFWVLGPLAAEALPSSSKAKIVPLSSSRIRIRVEGAPARQVLMKGIAVDFHPSAFAVGQFAQTGVHHMPVLVHCIGENAFHIYVMRTFALCVWEWLTDAALEYAG